MKKCPVCKSVSIRKFIYTNGLVIYGCKRCKTEYTEDEKVYVKDLTGFKESE